MSISTLRRQVKNVALNFSDAQVKVREATSNDPWGPTTALMSEIATLTHNPIAFTEIMSMIWKRLNDHGKNWRHGDYPNTVLMQHTLVYKSLVLLDYLIKCGSEKVAHQCRENIYSIETLRDFQHIEDNRDQGLNVREKAKQMVSLLKDEERLKNERARFLLTRKRFIQNGSSISSNGATRSTRRPGSDTGVVDYELEEARPSSLGEEEMQLQIAIALSKEESEKEKDLRRGDDVRLQMALEESRKDMERHASVDAQKMIPGSSLSKDALEDLLSLGLGEPEAPSTSAQAYSNMASASNDPWAPAGGSISATSQANQTPTSPILMPASNDPWAPPPSADAAGNGPTKLAPTAPAQNDPWALFEASSNTPAMAFNVQGEMPKSEKTEVAAMLAGSIGQQRPNVKTPENFLGENSSLVNLDNLMGTAAPGAKTASNPFVIGGSSTAAPANNPFAAQQRPSPSLNEMISAQRSGNHTSSRQMPLNGAAMEAQHQSVTNPFSP